jgi:SSS family solute:Na+ symporter
VTSIIFGFVVSLFWLLLVHANTVKKLGTESILKGSTWAHVDPILIGLPLSALVFVGVSLLTKPLPQEHVEKCYQSFSS